MKIIKQTYIAPSIAYLSFERPISLMASLSIRADFIDEWEEWEEGADI